MAGRLARMWQNRRDDRGFTLTELMVSMSVLAVVMVVVTGAVLLASGTSARVDAATSAQVQTHLSFQKLDRQVRWASGFSTPGVVRGDDYVEWLYTASGAPTCFQLRLDTTQHRLQQRSWTQGDLRTATAWQPIAAGVTTAPGVTAPFTVPATTAASPLGRLRIALTATAGGAKGTDTSTQDVTYTAVNSNGATVPTTVCSEGRTP